MQFVHTHVLFLLIYSAKHSNEEANFHQHQAQSNVKIMNKKY